jgi:tRNA 2-thiouridine synthesizing protein A
MVSIGMTDGISVDKILDVRGLRCPMPIVKANNAIKEMRVGEIIKVISTDPGSRRDFESWCKKTGNKLLEISEEGGVFTYIIQKTV